MLGTDGETESQGNLCCQHNIMMILLKKPVLSLYTYPHGYCSIVDNNSYYLDQGPHNSPQEIAD